MANKAPPYGRTLAERLASPDGWPNWSGTSPDGHAVTIWVAAGGHSAWSWAEREHTRRLLLLAPFDHDPSLFDWSLTKQHAPVVVTSFDNVTADFLERLAVAILRDGCQRVLVHSSNGILRYCRQDIAA